MNLRRILLALVVAGTAAWTMAQETRTYSRETSVQTAEGTKTVTISGEVVRYEPGQTIVIRDPNKRVVTYTIGPDVTVPAEIPVGRRVTVTTEPSDSGPAVVTRITTTSMSSDGQTRTTTEKTEMGASGETKTTTTTVYGTVSAFEPGQSITITREQGEPVTYVVDQQSQLPSDLAVGKKVTVRTTTIKGSPVARTVTDTTTKTKIKTKD